MVYIDIRYTPPIEIIDDDGTITYDYSVNEQENIIKFMYEYLKWSVQAPKLVPEDSPLDIPKDAYIDEPKYIVNVERYNKFGEKTHLHYHMNFYIPDHVHNKTVKKDSLAKRLIRSFGLKGNKIYSLRVHADMPENVNRWWRYPLKQSNVDAEHISDEFNEDDIRWVHGFTLEEITAMHVLAADEYEQRKIENCETRQKMADKNNFRSKLIKHFKKKADDRSACGGVRFDDKQLWCAIASYYMEHKMTPPFGKMDDLLIDLKVEIGYMSIHDYYDLTH